LLIIVGRDGKGGKGGILNCIRDKKVEIRMKFRCIRLIAFSNLKEMNLSLHQIFILTSPD
jgi:hypothetical protein